MHLHTPIPYYLTISPISLSPSSPHPPPGIRLTSQVCPSSYPAGVDNTQQRQQHYKDNSNKVQLLHHSTFGSFCSGREPRKLQTVKLMHAVQDQEVPVGQELDGATFFFSGSFSGSRDKTAELRTYKVSGRL